GAVRDALLDLPATRDVDIAVEGDATDIARRLADALGVDVETRGAFSTATLHLPLEDGGGALQVDFASCRTETYAEPGALPCVRTGVSIEDDLPRRDVAANAIAVALDGEPRLVAAPGALDDVRERRLRVLHDASFRDDPTRVFRVARYAGRL